MVEKKEQTRRIKNLYAEVVTSAIRDFKTGKGFWYTDAKEFLKGEWLEFYLTPLNVHQDFIRKVLLCHTSTSTEGS